MNMIYQFIVVLSFFSILTFLGFAIMLNFWKKEKCSLTQYLWMCFYTGSSYVMVLGINLSFGKMAFYQGGYGLIWLKGWYFLLGLAVLLLLYKLINSPEIWKHFIKLSKSVFKGVFIITLLATTMILIQKYIGLPSANLVNLGYFSNGLILDRIDYLTLNTMPRGLIGLDMLYSLFSGWLISNTYILDTLTILFGIGLIYLLVYLINTLRDIKIRIIEYLLIILIFFGGFRLVSSYVFSELIAWCILLQTILLIIKARIFDNLPAYSSNMKSFDGRTMILGLSISSLLMVDPLLAKLLLVVGLIMGIIQTVTKTNDNSLINWLKILLISILLNPIVFGSGII